jgi:hypothetical protein
MGKSFLAWQTITPKTDAGNSMTLDAGGPLAGGSITVDGLTITVPTNLLATLPAISVAWAELFNNGVPNLPGSISWEATVCCVQLNRINFY